MREGSERISGPAFLLLIMPAVRFGWVERIVIDDRLSRIFQLVLYCLPARIAVGSRKGSLAFLIGTV